RPIRCKACGAEMLVPKPKKVPAPRPILTEEEESLPDGCCCMCRQEGEGDTYEYFVGVLDGVTAKAGEEPLTVRYTTSYCNVALQELYLCDDCARELWHDHFKGRTQGWVVALGCWVVAFVVLLLMWGGQPIQPAGGKVDQVALGLMLSAVVVGALLLV